MSEDSTITETQPGTIADTAAGAISEQQVANYLAEHPDFFANQLDLLSGLRVPHPTQDKAVSLLERQLMVLRDQSDNTRRQLQELVEVARENERLSRQLHELTLALIETGTLEEVLNTLQDELRSQFQADAVELRLFSQAELEKAVNEGEPGPSIFRRLMEQGRPKCGALNKEQLSYLFGSQASEAGSVALVPITAKRTLGILAIGSRDPARFHPGKGTDFLRRLGEVVSRTLQVMLEPGA